MTRFISVRIPLRLTAAHVSANVTRTVRRNRTANVRSDLLVQEKIRDDVARIGSDRDTANRWDCEWSERAKTGGGAGWFQLRRYRHRIVRRIVADQQSVCR